MNMKVSELIMALQAYQEAEGDHEVVDSYDDPIDYPVKVDDVCVLADKA
jgi:hypothetical protein